MDNDMELQGMDELLSQLQLIGNNVSRMENKALKAGAQPVAEEMRSLVPVSSIDHKHIVDDIQVSGVKSKDGVKYVEIGQEKKSNKIFDRRRASCRDIDYSGVISMGVHGILPRH